ncbi:MAG: S1 family peptidase [Myxococcaceae bacterium]
MRLILVLLALFLSACGSEKSRGFEVSQSAIINGQQCLTDEFPASVEILVDALVDVSPLGVRHLVTQICGGTLIRPDVVLTAAHCLSESEITQGFGKILKLRFAVVNNLDLKIFSKGKRIPKEAIKAVRWKVHEQYNNKLAEEVGLKHQNDIAVLFLAKPFDVKSVQLLSSEERQYLSSQSQVDIVGWGQQALDSDLQDSATVLQKMCGKTQINELGEFEMQIGSDEKSTRKCYGDSGGATYLTLPNGELRLIGVTSHSYDTEGCSKGGIDTRVDAYWDWIHEQLNVIQ